MKQWFRNVWAAMRGRVPANADVAVDVGRIIEARNRSERAAQQAVDARVAVASEFPGFLAALESVRIALDQVPSKINVTLTGTREGLGSPHFLAPELASRLRRKGRMRAPQLVVVTDYDAHRIWAHAHVERYCVAGAAAEASLVTSSSAPLSDLSVSGPPRFIYPK